MRAKNAAKSLRSIQAAAVAGLGPAGILLAGILIGGLARADDEGRLVWSVRTQPVAPPPSVAGDGRPEPVVGPGFAAWSTGRAIHAVRLEDGGPLDGGDGPAATELVSVALATGAVAAPAAARLSRPCQAGGRLFATVIAPARDAAARLVAIDCSPAGGGRVEWTTGLPEAAVAFEGPPWIEGERLAAIVVGDGPRMPRLRATFDLFDGRHLGSRPAAEGDAPPPATHRAAAGGGRLIVATDRTIECRQGPAADR